MGYQPKRRFVRSDIAAWILLTPVDELSELVLAGVNLDSPPMDLVENALMRSFDPRARPAPPPLTTVPVPGIKYRA